MTALCNSGSTRAICASCAGSPLRYLMYSTGFTAEPSLGSTAVGLLAPETAPAPAPASGGFLMSMTTSLSPTPLPESVPDWMIFPLAMRTWSSVGMSVSAWRIALRFSTSVPGSTSTFTIWSSCVATTSFMVHALLAYPLWRCYPRDLGFGHPRAKSGLSTGASFGERDLDLVAHRTRDQNKTRVLLQAWRSSRPPARMCVPTRPPASRSPPGERRSRRPSPPSPDPLARLRS